MIDTLTTGDGMTLDVRHWPLAQPRAVIVILHGMAEHIGRYDRFATAMNSAGYAVIGHDQRGHGATAGGPADWGFLAETDGWQRLVDDAIAVIGAASREHLDVPIFLLGHSMGTLVARCVVQESDRVAGLILSGTPADPGPIRRAGQAIAAAEIRRRGARHRSTLLHKMSFGAFNDAIEHPRTAFDWLTRDADEVDAYVADPACGWIATASFYRDLFAGVGRANASTCVARTPRHLPVLFLSGDADPCGGDGGRGVVKAANLMRRHVDRVDLRLYAGCRHELFHEIDATSIFADVERWIGAHL